MPVRKLKEFLDQNKIKYVTISHSPAYTAQEIAASAHVSGRDLAKTVMVKLDGKIAMAVVPATRKVDLEKLEQLTGASRAELATEQEFEDLFPDCEVGAMPPFGGLYGMDLYVSERLAEDAEIVFSAGTHSELIRLSYQDYKRVAEPRAVAL